MQADEQAIRHLVDKWMAASKAGDWATVMTLMDDNVLFMVPGREPFGKDVFAAGANAMKNIRIEGTSNIQELKVLGDWAWMRNHIKMTITPPGGNPTTRSGYTLTILRKNHQSMALQYCTSGPNEIPTNYRLLQNCRSAPVPGAETYALGLGRRSFSSDFNLRTLLRSRTSALRTQNAPAPATFAAGSNSVTYVENSSRMSYRVSHIDRGPVGLLQLAAKLGSRSCSWRQ